MDAARVRLDPCCMIPCDRLARKVVGFMNDALPDASRHAWAEVPQSLIIDNRRVLHARDGVDASDLERVIERVAFWIPEPS